MLHWAVVWGEEGEEALLLQTQTQGYQYNPTIPFDTPTPIYHH